MDDSCFDPLRRLTHALSVALGYRDPTTRLHSERVRGLSLELGARCGLSSRELGILSIGASFHDIGKIGIADSILMKTTQLTLAEREVVREHSEIGARIMASIELEGALPAALVIRHHHEHYDGQGYPHGLSAEEIPICSRIIAIADSYDAMAVRRPYHPGLRHATIMNTLLAETGRKHDPALMQMFGGIIENSRYRAPSD